MSYNFKNLADVEMLTEVPEGASVFAEVNGAIKRVPGNGLGGGNFLAVTFNLISDQNNGGAWSIECNTTFQQVDEVVKNFGFILSQIIYLAGTPEARAYPCYFPRHCAAGEYSRTEQECYVFETQQYLGCDVWLNADGTPGFLWWD